MAAELAEAQVRNFQRWRILNSRIDPSPCAFRTYEEHVTDLKRWIIERMHWIDGQFPVSPSLHPPGGRVPVGTHVTFEPPGVAIYYTMDGSDPRATDRTVGEQAFLASNAPARALVPTQDLGETWKEPAFDDSNWRAGVTGVGYEKAPTAAVNYRSLIGLDILDQIDAVPGGAHEFKTANVRIPFHVDNPSVERLVLRLKYDDGFVAYLNGAEIARANMPASVTWDTPASLAHNDNDAIVFQEFDVSQFRPLLRAGTNLLAFQVANTGIVDPDMLLLPELVGRSNQAGISASARVYTGPIRIDRETRIFARSLVDGVWSAPVLGTFAMLPINPDFSGDGSIDQIDIQLLCAALPSANVRFDLDDNGRTDHDDLLFFIQRILLTVPGDADLDGQFTSSDLVRVFQAGEYEDPIAGNSSWSDGDWNCDGEFTSLDLVFAFSTGRFAF
jgi:hypothetical protein